MVSILFQTPSPPSSPGHLMETPDVLIGIDMHSANADNWDQVKEFVTNTVQTMAEYFQFGGCLDEMRVGVFQVFLHFQAVNFSLKM